VQAAFVADTCGSPTAYGQDAASRRLPQEGTALVTAVSVIAELSGGYATYSPIMRG
jgi:hypothetical protein